MNGELLFRVYSEPLKKYLRGILNIPVFYSSGCFSIKGEGLIIEPFTGKTDKDGNRIFAHDLVDVNGLVWEVIWENKYGFWDLINESGISGYYDGSTLMLHEYDSSKLTRIGSIRTNDWPEY